MTAPTKISLKPGKEAGILRFHPWVFSGAIEKIHGAVQEGDGVEVYDSKNNYIGTGHCQIGSIAVRIFTFTKTDVDYNFWKQKLTAAYNYRKSIGLTNNVQTNAYRLCYAEGDGLPGLIIDFYNGTAVLQAHTVGMYLIRTQIADALKEIYGNELIAVYDKSEETLPKQTEIKASNGYLHGQLGSNEVLENKHKFLIDWEHGQKTGFFIDQRENRNLLALYSKGKTVLNTFCYSGGFSVYAAKAGAELVHSVDSSKKAIELTEKNIELNFPAKKPNHQSFVADTFNFLKEKKNNYDIIILDPPAFAKSRDSKHNAVIGYKRINAEAIKQIKPGGILFTFSCSQVINRPLFEGAVLAAAIEAGRQVRIMHRLSHPADHPVTIFHPEGEYLKGLVLYIG